MDLYQILELNKDATHDDIRKNYKRLAIKYHPDKNTNKSEAKEKFIQIDTAYKILSNKQKRIAYDNNSKISEQELQELRKMAEKLFNSGVFRILDDLDEENKNEIYEIIHVMLPRLDKDEFFRIIEQKDYIALVHYNIAIPNIYNVIVTRIKYLFEYIKNMFVYYINKCFHIICQQGI